MSLNIGSSSIEKIKEIQKSAIKVNVPNFSEDSQSKIEKKATKNYSSNPDIGKMINNTVVSQEGLGSIFKSKEKVSPFSVLEKTSVSKTEEDDDDALDFDAILDGIEDKKESDSIDDLLGEIEVSTPEKVEKNIEKSQKSEVSLPKEKNSAPKSDNIAKPETEVKLSLEGRKWKDSIGGKLKNNENGSIDLKYALFSENASDSFKNTLKGESKVKMEFLLEVKEAVKSPTPDKINSILANYKNILPNSSGQKTFEDKLKFINNNIQPTIGSLDASFRTFQSKGLSTALAKEAKMQDNPNSFLMALLKRTGDEATRGAVMRALVEIKNN